ncbi:MAG TPA: acyltransferase [Kiritimatiellia bacterium]|nr:acyltransferase [Kiritimatiellia bacterium]
MKSILEAMFRVRDPAFRVDPKLSGHALWAALRQGWTRCLRGRRVWLHGKQPRGLMLGRAVQFFNPRDITWGRNNVVGDYSYIHALGPDSLVFGDGAGVGCFCTVVTSVQFNDVSGFIRLGRNAWIGDGSNLGGAGGLEIGDDTFTGQYVTFHPENHRFDNPHQLMRLQGVTRKGIKVGRNCWIGAKVTITDGVTIGDHCVIAAGAVVTRDIPSNSVAAGVPAKVIRTLEASTV